MKRVITGILSVAFGLLGMYCSVRAFQVYRDLHGRPAIDDSGRDWSTGATACLVACGVIATLGRKNTTATDDAVPSKWWKSPVGITLLAAVGIVVAIIIVLVLGRSPPPASPAAAPVEMPRVAMPAPSTAP